jgi:hypothetical protein
MRDVNMVPAALAAYRDDPAGYLREYERTAPPAAELTADERAALLGKDYAALYALGAHPYLLWSFIEAALVPPMPRAELVESFRVAARAAGYPEWSTAPFGSQHA